MIWTEDTVKQFLSDNKLNYTLESIYHNGKEKRLILICDNNHVIDIRPSHLKNGVRCKFCKRKYFNTESFNEYVKKLTNNEYEVLSEFKNFKTKMTFKHNSNLCNCNVFLMTPDMFAGKKNNRCPLCSRKNGAVKKTKTHEEFSMQVEKLVGKEYSICGNYVTDGVKIKFKHNICNKSFAMKPSNFLQGQRCPHCKVSRIREKQTISTEEFKSLVESQYGKEYLVDGEYKNARTKIQIIHNCEKCHYSKFMVTPDNFLNKSSGCPMCSESKGEKAISNFLYENNVEFEIEYSFDDLRGIKNGLLRFDFAIFKNNSLKALVEYNGIQHYKPVERFGGKKGFKVVLLHDVLKKNYCSKNNIKLIIIKFNQFKSIDNILKLEILKTGDVVL